MWESFIQGTERSGDVKGDSSKGCLFGSWESRAGNTASCPTSPGRRLDRLVILGLSWGHAAQQKPRIASLKRPGMRRRVSAAWAGPQGGRWDRLTGAHEAGQAHVRRVGVRAEAYALPPPKTKWAP